MYCMVRDGMGLCIAWFEMGWDCVLPGWRWDGIMGGLVGDGMELCVVWLEMGRYNRWPG